MQSAYLITWKPDTENKEKGWPEAGLKKLFDELRIGGGAQEVWRFARQKGVKAGERVYLLRQGRRGHALLGFGHVSEAPVPGGERSALISFEALVNPASGKVFATHEELHAITSASGVWNTQSSGVLLPNEIAMALAELAKRGELVEDKRPSSVSNPDWTRDELILALDLYFREPSARGNKTHPACRELSGFLNDLPIHGITPHSVTFRNANGVAMKLSNFLRYDPTYSGAGLSSGSQSEEEVWTTFAAHPEKLKEAASAIRAGATELRAAGVFARDDEEEAEEGRILTRVHKLRERDSRLVRAKKTKVFQSTGALKCEVCTFDFAAEYGQLGHGFAECHHGRPVSQLESGSKTRLSDLHVVCANCHRMLHRGKKWLTVSELKVHVGGSVHT